MKKHFRFHKDNDEFKMNGKPLEFVLLNKIKSDVIKFLLNLNIIISNENEDKKEQLEKKSFENKKVGRNDKCPCGSGKKFKHCHGNV